MRFPLVRAPGLGLASRTRTRSCRSHGAVAISPRPLPASPSQLTPYHPSQPLSLPPHSTLGLSRWPTSTTFVCFPPLPASSTHPVHYHLVHLGRASARHVVTHPPSTHRSDGTCLGTTANTAISTIDYRPSTCRFFKTYSPSDLTRGGPTAYTGPSRSVGQTQGQFEDPYFTTFTTDSSSRLVLVVRQISCSTAHAGVVPV